MTLAEQVSILSGDAFWTVNPIDRLGIGRLRVTDGPNGARGSDFIGGTTAAAFPVGIAIGATWNPSLAYEIGSAIADEVKSKGRMYHWPQRSTSIAASPTAAISNVIPKTPN